MIGLEQEEEWQFLESEAKKADHTRFRFRQQSDSHPTGRAPKTNATIGADRYMFGSHGRVVTL